MLSGLISLSSCIDLSPEKNNWKIIYDEFIKKLK
jgi:hypothetical protein